jgi:glutathione S-transferase
MILWGVKASPYVQKVMVLFAEKKLPYEHRAILPKVLLLARNEPVSEIFERISPIGKIPALQIGNWGIADSSIICAFIEKQFPNSPLLYPTVPRQLAEALWFERYADTTFTDVVYKKIFFEKMIKPHLLNRPTNEECVKQAVSGDLPPLLAYLDKSIEKKDWLVNNHFSIADIAIGVQLLSLKKCGIDIGSWKSLENYFHRITERPSFIEIATS